MITATGTINTRAMTMITRGMVAEGTLIKHPQTSLVGVYERPLLSADPYPSARFPGAEQGGWEVSRFLHFGETYGRDPLRSHSGGTA